MTMIAQFQDQLNNYLDRLSLREKWLVIVTTIFVLCAGIGSALWAVHQAAEREQQRVSTLKDLMVWMQTNAVNMKPASEAELSVAEKIQRTAQQTSLSVSSQQQGEQIQIVAAHADYAMLANFVMQLAQIGLTVEKMQFSHEANQIKLTAMVR